MFLYIEHDIALSSYLIWSRYGTDILIITWLGLQQERPNDVSFT